MPFNPNSVDSKPLSSPAANAARKRNIIEHKAAEMLFNREIEALHDDGFEGSVNEHHTTRKVYFGNDGGRGTKRCLVTGVINFERDSNKDTDVSLCSTSGISAITSQEDPSDVKENSRVKSEPLHLSEEFQMTMRNTPDTNVKRVKLAVDDISNTKPYIQKVTGETWSASHAVSHTVTRRIVESARQGVSCSCYLLKKYMEIDPGRNTSYKDISECRLSSLDGSEQKEAGAGKTIASPASQESSATKLLAVNPSAIVAIDSGCRQIAKPRWKDSCFVELDEAEMSLSEKIKTDPRRHLRYHIHCLLKAAGWVIGRRVRSNKYNGIGEYVYKSPEGRPIREFRRAWVLCGQELFVDSNNALGESDGNQWTDLTQFWSDFSNTSTKIEEMDKLETTTELACCWYLLDPFAIVMFIDKTFSSLKAGKVVKVRRSLVIDSGINHDGVLPLKCVENAGNLLGDRHVTAQPCGSYLVSDSALTVVDEDVIQQYQYQKGQTAKNGHLQTVAVTAQKGLPSTLSEENCQCSSQTFCGADIKFGEISGSKRSSLDPLSLQLYDSDSSSEQMHNGLFDVPISTQDANMYLRSEDNNMNAQCSDKDRSNDNEEVPFRVIKKSNKLSDIKLTTLYQNQDLDISISRKTREDSILSEMRLIQECSRKNIRSNKMFGKTSACSVQQCTEKKLSRQQKFGHVSGETKKLTLANYDNEHPDGLSLPLKYESLGSGIKSRKPKAQCGNGEKKALKCQLKDDDLLISAVITTKNYKSATERSSKKKISCKSRSSRKHKNQKGSCRLLPRSFKRGGVHYVEEKWSILGSRTVLSWLINSGVVSLNEVILYRNTKDDTVVKDGLVTWDGILCRCCNMVLSLSEFKSHAGFKLNRPCLNLFMESGKPFTLCQLEAWSAEYKARKSATLTVQVDDVDQNDDSCGLCGGGGELICCDNCPSTYHQACLNVQELPEGNWYCLHCTCQICSNVVNDKEASKTTGALTCSQCEHKYHELCLNEQGVQVSLDSDIWFCGESCKEVYSGLHSCVGLMHHISDGFSWTLLRCIHGDKKVHSAQRFVALKAECNIKLAVALTIMEECFLPMVDPRTGIDMIPHVLYNWGSQFARLNYHGFYTVVLEKNDVVLSVASIRIHGATVAEMPLIATCSRYRRQGMCRHLMNAIEEMLRSIKVEKLVISAIPSLVETWTVGFGFEPLEDNERESMRTINLMVFPGTVWLKKSFSKNHAALEPQLGSCHASPSEKDDLAEFGDLPKGHVEEPVQHEGNLGTEKDQNEDLDIDFSKLSCEETDASLGRNQLEVDSIGVVDALEVYRDGQNSEQSTQSNVLQRNDERN